MKRLVLWIALSLLVITSKSYAQETAETNHKSLRLLCYNIRNAKGMDNVVDYQRIANVINGQAPAVVALQELDSVTARSGQKDVLNEIAQRTSMFSVYGAAINYDGGKYGVGVLSKEKPLSSYSVPLPGREEQRVLLVVEFEKYLLACTHLSLTEADRNASVAVITEEASKANKPFILAGDWNALPTSDFMQAMLKNFTLLSDSTMFTIPPDKPNRCIDYIGVYNRNEYQLKTLHYEVLNEPVASDHLPIVADILMD